MLRPPGTSKAFGTARAVAERAALAAEGCETAGSERKRCLENSGLVEGAGDIEGSNRVEGADAADAALTRALPKRHVALIRLSVSCGRNRIVRRLLAAVGLPVYGLHRVRIGPLHIDDCLPALAEPGSVLQLTVGQEDSLRAACGLTCGPPSDLPSNMVT